jgi:hypothetical protein
VSNRTVWIKTTFCLAVVFAFLAIGWRAFDSLRQVNEPDPRHVTSQVVEQKLKALGIEVKVDEVLYVYLDVSTYIFKGRVLSVKPSWKQVGLSWFSDPKGIILNEKGIVGYSDWSYHAKPEPHFAENWKKSTE